MVSILLMMLASFLWMLSQHKSTEKDVINDDDDTNVDVEASSQRFYHFDKLDQLATISLQTTNPEVLVVSYTQQGKKERGATGTPGWGNAVLNFAAVNGMVQKTTSSNLISSQLFIPSPILSHAPLTQPTIQPTNQPTNQPTLSSPPTLPTAFDCTHTGIEFASTCLPRSCGHFHLVQSSHQKRYMAHDDR